MEYILAIDEGTTNAKAVAVSSDGVILSAGSRPLGVRSAPHGEVTQNAEEIWTRLLEAVGECVAGVGSLPEAVAVSNQRESVVAWDVVTGASFAPILGWQDSRTEPFCESLRVDGAAPFVASRTGMRLDAMFSAPKLRWLQDNVGNESRLRIGTVDTWLISKLTGQRTYAAEAGNASRTLLLDLDELQWSDQLCDLFGVRKSLLAPVVRSDADFGTTADLGVLPAGIPIVAVLGDSHAALFGHGCRTPGAGKATYGTGSSVMVAAGSRRPRMESGPMTLAWMTDAPFYGFEGNIVWAGSAMDWVARILDVEPGRALDSLAAQVPDSDGIAFVPAFTGLGAPWWDRTAVAVFSGMTAGSGRSHMARAALESTCQQVADVIESMKGIDLVSLHADGGPSRSPLLMQTQADLLGRRVEASVIKEASALGAAFMGFAHLGWPIPSDLEADARTYESEMSEERRLAKRSEWKNAVNRSRLVP